MTLLGPTVLSDLRAIVNSSLTTTCTNSRTSVVLPCRVNAEKRAIHMQGMPSLMQLRRWRIALPAFLPDGVTQTDTTLGDRLDVVGQGVFLVTGISNKATNNVSGTVTAYIASDVEVQATFKQRVTESVMPGSPVYVFFEPMSLDYQLAQRGEITYSRHVIWPANLVFSNGKPVQQGDYITWTEYSGETVLRGAIQQPFRRGQWAVALVKTGV